MFAQRYYSIAHGAPICKFFWQAMVIPLLLKCIEAADDEDSAYCH